MLRSIANRLGFVSKDAYENALSHFTAKVIRLRKELDKTAELAYKRKVTIEDLTETIDILRKADNNE